MKFKSLILILIFSLVSSNTFSQVLNCNISFIDSNSVKRNYKFVSLESFYKDTLIFSDNFKLHKSDVRKITSLSYMTEKKKSTGFWIGAGIGAGLTILLALAASGFAAHSNSDSKLNPVTAILAGIVGGAIGGVIGNIFQPTHKELKKVNFNELSLKEKRRQIKTIFEFYDERKN